MIINRTQVKSLIEHQSIQYKSNSPIYINAQRVAPIAIQSAIRNLFFNC